MQRFNSFKQQQTNRRGAMLVLVGIFLPLFLIFSTFAINVAWMQLARTELRTATDSAARAASRTFSLTQDIETARTAAREAAARNYVAGVPMVLADDDIVFGMSTEETTGRFAFAATTNDAQVTGVRVIGDRSAGSATGAVPMLFKGILNRGTFEPVRTATASHIDRDVTLVLDRSGSMLAGTENGSNRWKDLKAAVAEFLTALESTPQEEQVGVASYSTRGSQDEALSLDYQQVISTVDEIRLRGATAIGRGMQAGMATLLDETTARRTAARTLVVMTDGQHNVGIDPREVADEAAAQNITVHTLTFGRGAEQERMREVAASGNGQHWHADNRKELIQAFEEIAANLPTLITE